LKPHPNPYLLADLLRDELKLAVSDANMAKLGNANTRKQRAKFVNLEKRRQKLIENLK
jgi:hypothetical protein